MNEKDFLEKMKEMLDNEDVTMASLLSEIEEWDSLSIVSYAAMTNAVGKSVTLQQIRGCATVGDLFVLLQ